MKGGFEPPEPPPPPDPALVIIEPVQIPIIIILEPAKNEAMHMKRCNNISLAIAIIIHSGSLPYCLFAAQ